MRNRRTYSDQRHRYELVGRYVESRLRIALEVGGAQRPSPSRPRPWADTVFTANLTGYTDNPPHVWAHSGSLPYADDQFELVVAVDVLEHIPPPDRAQAVAEMRRVCEGDVILVFPYGSTLNLGLERYFERLCRVLRPEVPRWLRDHRAGLPRLSDDYFAGAGIKAHTSSWLLFYCMFMQVLSPSSRANLRMIAACSWVLSRTPTWVERLGTYRAVAVFHGGGAEQLRS